MTADATFAGGAVRSADADGLDFLSVPLIGLIGVAKAAAEGAAKYGRFNYLRGIPAHVCVNHAVRHLLMWAMGDRSEPHLSHAAWNVLAAEQSMVLDPEINGAHLPGPGYTVSPEMAESMAREAPILSALRRNPAWRQEISDWDIRDLPEVEAIMARREGEADDYDDFGL